MSNDLRRLLVNRLVDGADEPELRAEFDTEMKEAVMEAEAIVLARLGLGAWAATTDWLGREVTDRMLADLQHARLADRIQRPNQRTDSSGKVYRVKASG